MCILIFIFLDSKLEDTRFFTEWENEFPDLNLFLISSWMQFDLLMLFPRSELFHTFKGFITYPCYDFVLLYGLETWLYTDVLLLEIRAVLLSQQATQYVMFVQMKIG